MTIRGLSSSVIISYMEATSNISKELRDLGNMFQLSLDKKRYPESVIRPIIIELSGLENNYTKVHNDLHREFTDRMQKSLSLDKSIPQVMKLVGDLVKDYEFVFHTDEQFKAYKESVKKVKKGGHSDKVVKGKGPLKKV